MDQQPQKKSFRLEQIIGYLKKLVQTVPNEKQRFRAVIFFLTVAVLLTALHLSRYPVASFFEKKILYYSILSSVQPPTFPDRRCVISDYGAVPGGKTKNTEAFRAAFEDCSRNGGGHVIVPEGLWLTGAIHFRDNIDFHLEEGSEIIWSDKRSDYLPVVFSRFQGMEYYNYSPLLYGNGVRNVAITGEGTLNGDGDKWLDWDDDDRGRDRLYKMAEQGVPVEERVFGERDNMRPSFIQFINSQNLLIENIHIKNSPFWTIHPIYSENIIIRNITLENDGQNTDGVDIDSSRNVLIENSHFSADDDSIAIKSGLEKDGWRVNKPSENILIRNSTMTKGHSGVAIGSEMSGGVRNVIITDNTFIDTDGGFKIKSLPGRGGVVENIWLSDTEMSLVPIGISFDMAYASGIRGKNDDEPVFRNILISDIRMSGVTRYSLFVHALGNESVSGIDVTNLRSDYPKASIRKTDGVRITRSTIDQ